MTPSPLPPIMIEPLVRMALLEDLGRAGDLTTDAIVPAGHRATTLLVARQTGVVAGLDLARLAFQLIDPAIEIRLERNDGAAVAPGDVIATIAGPARGILTAERVALNFLCRLSGIATATASVVAVVRHTRAKIVCTRKTTPGQAVAMVAGGAAPEASGPIPPATAPQIAATGVDLISIGWLTHSVGILDIGLDFQTLAARASAASFFH